MSLAPGTRLGPYEVVSPLGVGGMGEVYRARDPRLGRDVAIKALPADVSHDAERLARFEREARLLASLSHPNIAGIHGLEDVEGQRYLVLEYVEGETLARRLGRGPLPLDEALGVCREIAAGVEAAHEGGIVHRDLKPGNVMLTPAGGVKVLDFGLAKGGAAAKEGSDPALSTSPTMTHAATQAGVVLGTAAYMSPEQARGRAVDRRTDIWSFGCVLYECLAGRPVFEGETVSDLVARILEREPDWAVLPVGVPARVRELLRRCLVKDPKQRLRDIGDARIELEQVMARSSSGAIAVQAEDIAGGPAARRIPWWAAAIGVITLTVLAVLLVGRVTERAGPRIARRFEVSPPPGMNLVTDPVECAISPDGRLLAFAPADSSGMPRLWVRPIDSFAPRELPGTAGATQPFWSPDGRFIGFFAEGKLKKVPAAGGDVEILCDVRASRGGTWNRDGVILFAPTSNGPIFRVSANGGDPTPVTQLDSALKETAHRFPRFLPDGRHFTFSALTGQPERYPIEVGSLDSRSRRTILSAGSGVVYAEPGYLLYVRNDVLSAQRFDTGRLRLVGEPILLGDTPPAPATVGAPVVSAADDGTLAYVHVPLPLTRLAWFDASGREIQPVPLAPGPYNGVLLSPDGRYATIHRIVSNTQIDLLVVDLQRGTANRLTDGTGIVENEAWSPDGERIAYALGKGGPQSLVVARADGSGPGETVLPAGSDFRRVDGWTPDGKALVIGRLDPQTQWDLWVLPLEGDRRPRVYLQSRFNEIGSRVCPDGRWISYNSDESGRNEGYVQAFPTPGGKYQVTTDGTGVVAWRHDGRAIAFGPSPDGVVRVADVVPGPNFQIGPPRVLFRAPEQVSGADATADWSRFLLAVPAGKQQQASIHLILDWTGALASH